MFDRDIDLVSPFCIGQTYEAYLDEFFGIETCSIEVENKIVYTDAEYREKEKLKDNEKVGFNLTNEDVTFADIRNKHFNNAGPKMIQNLKEIKMMMEDKSQKTI